MQSEFLSQSPWQLLHLCLGMGRGGGGSGPQEPRDTVTLRDGQQVPRVWSVFYRMAWYNIQKNVVVSAVTSTTVSDWNLRRNDNNHCGRGVVQRPRLSTSRPRSNHNHSEGLFRT